MAVFTQIRHKKTNTKNKEYIFNLTVLYLEKYSNTVQQDVPWFLRGKESAFNAGDAGLIKKVGQEDLLEKVMATHCGIIDWEIPCT